MDKRNIAILLIVLVTIILIGSGIFLIHHFTKKTEDKPSSGGDKPSSGGDKPSSGGDKPSSGGDKPSSGGDRIVTTEKLSMIDNIRQSTKIGLVPKTTETLIININVQDFMIPLKITKESGKFTIAAWEDDKQKVKLYPMINTDGKNIGYTADINKTIWFELTSNNNIKLVGKENTYLNWGPYIPQDYSRLILSTTPQVWELSTL